MDYTGARLGVTAGRVAAIDVGVPVIGVVSDPEGGNVTVNPDGTLALVMPDAAQRGQTSFTVLVEDGGGTREMTVDLKLEAPKIEGGWGAGDHYTLETGADDLSVIEPGENHRKVYVTESNSALSIADIAAREGVRQGAIDGEWLAAHPEYGASAGMALDTEAAMKLWNQITGRYTEPASHHLLFEKGYKYDGTGRLIDRGTLGESELHPVLVGAWGNGAKPVIEDSWQFMQEVSKNIVFQGLDFAQGGSIVGSARNVILEDVILRDHSTVIQSGDQISLRHAQILDAADHAKTNGVYVTRSDGILLEHVFADHNGWQDGWENGNGNAPKSVNHNIYVQWNNLDVTFRDSVTMQGSSFGAQIRSGGVIENVAFLDNNVALNVQGGNNRSGGYTGNYSLILDTVTSSGAHKDAPGIGALTWGIRNLAPETSLVGNIIAHLADPADSRERAEKTVATTEPLKSKFATFVDDTIIYNWVTDDRRGLRNFLTDENLPAVAEAVLDEVTLRRFLEGELGGRNPGDVIDTLAGWLRGNWSDGATASDIVDFFQDGFGIGRMIETAAQSLRFVPDVRGDGMRWDNRLNWQGTGSDEELPQDGDSVDLGGNWVSYSGTTRLAALDLGEGGVLSVRQGRLDTASLETGAEGKLAIGFAGQFWTDGYAGDETLSIAVTGGRFVNNGAVTGAVDLEVSGGEVLLATGGARFDLDGRLAIEGSSAKIGFDGPGGAAVLSLMAGAELFFGLDATGVSAIREVRSGAWGTDAPGVTSTIDLGDGDTTLSLDLGDWKGGGGQLALAQADTLLGGFGEIDVTGKADVTVRIDYGTDRLELVSGSGPDLLLSGSSQDDLFVVAAGAAARIEQYANGDAVDLSAVLGSGDLGGLGLADAGSRVVQLVDGNAVLAEIEGEALDRVWVQADGWEARIGADGASNLKKLPAGAGNPDSAPAPSPRPDPVTAPDPEPVTATRAVPVTEADPVTGPEPEPAPENTAPRAADGQLRGAADEVLRGSLRATDADGDSLVFALEGGPRTGRVVVGEDGSFRYNPRGAYDELPTGETRTERFDFTVSDGQGGTDRGTFTLRLAGQYQPPAPPAEPDAPEWNPITGTAGFDVIEGTDGADLIRSGGGGYDRLWGDAGADAFVFGAGARDGVRSSDQIFDFDPDEDMLVLEAGAKIATTEDRGGMLLITLRGDSDMILVDGVAADAIDLQHSDGLWFG